MIYAKDGDAFICTNSFQLFPFADKLLDCDCCV